MKTMKKILALILALLMILGTFAACDTNIFETYTRNGNKITFGSYPQTEVTDSSLKSTLNSKVGTLPTSENSYAWTSYGYYISGNVENFMWYIDVITGGDKYRGVYFTAYRPSSTDRSSSTDNSYQDDNGYTTGTVYWFKYEPINWTILCENTTAKTALIFCDTIIDSRMYQDECEYDDNLGEYVINSDNVPNRTAPSNYAYSTIRKWLNETFYNTAFIELQKEIILSSTVDNSASTTHDSTNEYACENTSDKVFLLSYQDVINESYGFPSNDSELNLAYQKKNSDYAMAQGAYTITDGANAGNGSWLLRSPLRGGNKTLIVVNEEYSYVGPGYVDMSIGVVPVLQIRL